MQQENRQAIEKNGEIYVGATVPVARELGKKGVTKQKKVFRGGHLQGYARQK